METTNTNPDNIFRRLHPVQRVLIGVVLAAIVYFFARNYIQNKLVLTMLLWDVYAVSFIGTSWIVFFNRSVAEIRNTAREDDGSRFFVFIVVVIAAFASMATVMLLIVSKDVAQTPAAVYLPIVISGMLLSWILVHTTYTFHYAHMYYDDDENDSQQHAGGLDYPGEEPPDYIDFAYFSFVIGMTFQVSDVEISSRSIRRAVLVHGLLSFALNTFVVALTINLIAGLKS